MLINLRNALMAGKQLPYDAEVEYLSSSENAGAAGSSIPPVYINTGVTLSSGIKMSVTAAFNSTAQQIIGCYGGTRGRFDIGIDNTGVFLTSIGATTTRSTANTNIHEFVLDAPNAMAYIDGVGVTTGETFSVAIPGNVILFSRGRGDYTPPLDYNVAYSKVNMKIYSCKIWDNNILVRDYIPVRKGTVGYLYDRVSGKLFGNAGTGDFVLGPDVVPVEYLQSDGGQYIDTGFVATSTTKVQSSCALLRAASTYPAMWGARTISKVNDFQIYYNTSIVGGTPTAIVLRTGTSDKRVSRTDIGETTLLGARLDITAESGSLTVNGYNFTTPAFNFTTPHSLLAFCEYTGGTIQNFGAFKYWTLNIWDNGDPVRKFAPVRVGSGSTWEGAMMDTLTRRIYRNAGTGAFTYGNDLKYPIPAA